MKRTKLIAARVNHGLSQEALSEVIGVTRVTVNHWECGRTTPYPYYRKRLCEVLGVDHPKMLDIDYETFDDLVGPEEGSVPTPQALEVISSAGQEETEASESKDPNPRERSGQGIMLMVTIHLTVSIDIQNGVAVVEAVHIES